LAKKTLEPTDVEQRSTNDFANWVFLLAATTIGIIAFSHGASFDIIVTFPITAALVIFFVFEIRHERGEGSFLWLLLFYFFIGVALLAKGLIGVVFPFGIIGLYQLFSRRWPSRAFFVSLIWGPIVAIAVAATWYLPMYLQHGWQFIDEFIIQQHFQRFTSNKYQHPQPIYFFFWVLPLMTIPWLPFFVAAIWTSLKGLFASFRSEETKGPHATAIDSDSINRSLFSFSALLRFSSAWLLVPLIFFSFSGSKLPGYILPAVPAAILITAIFVFRFVEKSRVRDLFIKGVALSTFIVIFIALIFFVPGFARKESVKSLISAADAHGYASLPVAGFLTVSHNAEFYASGRLIRDADGKQHRFDGPHELSEYIRSHNDEPLLVLVPMEHVQNLTNNDLFRAQVLEQNGELAIVVLITKG
jgi:4-amino-4-deoxy-L-arabinose transferase-like glycosyltransferase